MRSTTIIGAALTAGLCGAAQAGGSAPPVPGSASASFQLDASTQLGNGGTNEEGTAGHWLGDNAFQASLVAGHDIPGPNDGRNLNLKSRTLDPAARNGTPFGVGAIDLPKLGNEALSAHASIGRGSLGVGWNSDAQDDEASATINWQRPFVLNPFSSVTFSGIATLMNTVTGTAPLPSFTEDSSLPDLYVHQAALVYRDEGYWQNGVNLIAHIFNGDPSAVDAVLQQRLPSFDDFTYSADPFGHLSLTVHNRSDRPMFGNFELFAYSWNALPVPEPATWLSMAVGLALLAGLRRARSSPSSASAASPAA